jgi:hypothetical protein
VLFGVVGCGDGSVDAAVYAWQGGILLLRGPLAVQGLEQCPFGGGEFLLRVGDPFAGRCPGRVGDLWGVGADVHPLVGQRVDAIVGTGVLEHVLDR